MLLTDCSFWKDFGGGSDKQKHNLFYFVKVELPLGWGLKEVGSSTNDTDIQKDGSATKRKCRGSYTPQQNIMAKQAA